LDGGSPTPPNCRQPNIGRCVNHTQFRVKPRGPPMPQVKEGGRGLH
jgi:hypothetical protein